jgi:hypothetical protein
MVVAKSSRPCGVNDAFSKRFQKNAKPWNQLDEKALERLMGQPVTEAGEQLT